MGVACSLCQIGKDSYSATLALVLFRRLSWGDAGTLRGAHMGIYKGYDEDTGN